MNLLLSVAFALVGLMLLVSIRSQRNRCTACGTHFRPAPELERFGHCPCPKCGMSVEVDQ